MTETTPITAQEWAARAESLRRGPQQQEALKAATEALKLDPKLAAMWDCIGFLLLQRGRWREAQNYMQQAVALEPGNPGFRCHYAIALIEDDKAQAAFDQINAALTAAPESGEALFIKAEMLQRIGAYDLAIPAYHATRQQLYLRKAAMYGEACATFITGAFEAGLCLMMEARPNEDPTPLPDWDGKPDPNLHLVLCGEYGFGDIIQFMRYVRAVQKKTGKVTLSLPYPLLRLMQTSYPDLPLHLYNATAEQLATLPAGVRVDLPADATARCFYTNMPVLLNEGFDAMAKAVPYIKADIEKVHMWRDRLAHIPRPHIGIVWGGNPLHQNDANRSVPPAMLTPLIEAAGPHLISLQREGKESFANLFDATAQIHDFADSAAVMQNLDLLITVDSAPAHLAGALGIPEWVMLPFNPDWRWLLGREDCIWYPTARLFRQAAPKDWESVMQKIASELQKFLNGDRSVLKPTLHKGETHKRHPQALQVGGV